MLLPLLLLSLAPQGLGSSNAAVVINEFSYDDTSTDTHEFIELYNRSKLPVDMTGWTIVSEDPSGPNFTLAVTAGVLPAGGFWLIGMAAVPGVNQTLTVSLENDNESLTLKDAGNNVIDTLVYESNLGLWNPALAEGEGVWGNGFLTESSPHTWSRVRDGYDNNDNGRDFTTRPWTPGRSNNLGRVNTLKDNFDTATPPATVAGLFGSFTPARVIDPTVVGPLVGTTPRNLNPNVITASPQGGNAAIFWDESGGGNNISLLSAPAAESSVECYVYVYGNPRGTLSTGATETESWSLGIQGGTGVFFNSPDPAGVLVPPLVANGNSGISWTYLATNASVTLYLIDHNNTGWGANAISAPTILATIPIVAGTNDGWQRLSLSLTGTTLSARFGGTVGQPDGTLYTATVSTAPGGVYVGYRELIADNSLTRPFTADALCITTCAAAGLDFFGIATANTASTPTIDHTGLPTLGGAVAVTGGGHLPSSTAFVAYGFRRATPLDLGAFGGVPGSRLYVDILDAPLVLTNAGGNLAFGFGIAVDRSLCGIQITFQTLQFDFGLGVAIPLAHSQAMTITVGL